MPQEISKLELLALAGLDIEKGKLVRSPNTFRRLENFTLTRVGAIEKVRGQVIAGPVVSSGSNAGEPDPIDGAVIGIRDYRRDESDAIRVIAIADSGVLYDMLRNNDNKLEILNTVSFGSGCPVPFMAVLPGNFEDDRIQYLIFTTGALNRVKKYDGNNITNVGVNNPEDNWDINDPTQHSARVIQVILTPDRDRGVPMFAARQYRFSWYNPTTKRDSNLFQIHKGRGLIKTQTEARTPGDTIFENQTEQPLNGAIGFNDLSVMEVVVALDGDVLVELEDLRPDPSYTKLRVWATRTGDFTFYLMPRVYDIFGAPLTDDEGAIITDTIGTDPRVFTTFFESYTGFSSPILDGFVGRENPNWPNSTSGIPDLNSDVIHSGLYDPAISTVPDIKVEGAGQGGTSLHVSVDQGADQFPWPGVFRIAGDNTNYSLRSFTNDGVIAFRTQYTFEILPALTKSPNDQADVIFNNLKPVTDQELVLASPLDGDRTRPPNSIWGAVFQNRLFLIPAEDPTTLIWSDFEDFESFPLRNKLKFLSDDLDPITALITSRQIGLVSEGAETKLVIAKARSSSKLIGSSEADFSKRDLHPQTGIVGNRAGAVVDSALYALTRHGIERLEGDRPVMVGLPINDLTDRIIIEGGSGPTFATDRKQGQILFTCNVEGFNLANLGPRVENNLIIIITGNPSLGNQGEILSAFSIITAIPTYLCCLHESGSGDHVGIIGAGLDGLLYDMFVGGLTYDISDENPRTPLTNPFPVPAVLETQELPQENKDTRKVFRRVRFEGNTIDEDDGWKISYSFDGGVSFTPPQKMYTENFIGAVAKTVVIKIQHNREVLDSEMSPSLSNMVLEFVDYGRAR